METMQTILEKDKDKFLQTLTGMKDPEKVSGQISRELSRILYVFNEQDESDAVKKAAMQMITSAQAMGSLVDCTGETTVYHRTKKETNSNGSLPFRFWFFLLLTVACGGGAAAMFILKGNTVTSIVELPIILVLLALMVLFTFLAGQGAHKESKKPKEEYLTATDYDPMKIYRALFTTVLAIDKQLSDVRMEEKSQQRKERAETHGDLSDAELDLLSSLLETAMADDDEGARQIVSEISYYLHQKGAETVQYTKEHQAWFDMMPSTGKAQTIRPAIVMDGMVLKKGLAAGGN